MNEDLEVIELDYRSPANREWDEYAWLIEQGFQVHRRINHETGGFYYKKVYSDNLSRINDM